MNQTYTDAQRMELRSHVSLAGEMVAPLWPMRTFISRNPLQGFEHRSFEDAVCRGEALLGARGSLPEEYYQEAFRQGRISQECLHEVLRGDATGARIRFGDRQLEDLDLLRMAMTHGLQLPTQEEALAGPCAEPGEVDRETEQLTRWLKALLEPEFWDVAGATTSDEWPLGDTLARWCDRVLGTGLTEELNRQMIKWCGAYCDEGESAWEMPSRERTFYRAWKSAAQHDASLYWLGLRGVGAKVQALPDRPEDALLALLNALKVPREAWQDYLAAHVSALPGWAGFIKWREAQTHHPWQEAYRIDLVKYLAVRVFYERELAAHACQSILGCEGTLEAVRAQARQFPHALWFRRALTAGWLPKAAVKEGRLLARRGTRAEPALWETSGRRWHAEQRALCREALITRHAAVLVRLAHACEMDRGFITATPREDLAGLLRRLRSFPGRVHRIKWLEALERTAQQEAVRSLKTNRRLTLDPGRNVRPLGQLVFCIDVRSEVFRRALERQGGYETYGFAGFFGLPVSYRSLDEPHEAELCPVLLRPKHVLREVPRTYQGNMVERRQASAKAAKMAETLAHDLKHNVVTPYVMVEAVGWFFGWPLLGKTLFPRWYQRLTTWWKRVAVPAVATTLTVDKLSTQDAEEMVAAEERIRIRAWLRTHPETTALPVTPDLLEGLRQQGLERDANARPVRGSLGDLLGVDQAHEATLLDDMRRQCGMTTRQSAARVHRATRTGFTDTEQAYYIETSLRLMGLTSTFARLVFLCGHGSTSQNNPYESALDCGACGGSHGLPNARAFAMMANRPSVREALSRRGLVIPPDTHFVAALHDTTTDAIRIADLEDVPATHRRELAQVLEDLQAATGQAAAERMRELAGISEGLDSEGARRAVELRSMDWAQVRPEWGLSGNHLFIVGSRRLTQGVDLRGRSFLHSYDHTVDTEGKLLEAIMTAPLIVAQWINLEYYFSTVDQQVYGSGSKVYHNVVGRIGVMAGNQSDLRMGLPAQTVWDGARPYHEPMRLTAIIEAPRERVTDIIARQPLLQRLFRNQWLWLIVHDPATARAFRYDGVAGWRDVEPVEVGAVEESAALHA